MIPINRKTIITGGAWEMRIKLTHETRKKYDQLKQVYDTKHGRSYSASALFARLIEDVSTLHKLTP